MLHDFWISSLATGTLRFTRDVPDDVLARWLALSDKQLKRLGGITFFAAELDDDRFLGRGRCMIMTPHRNDHADECDFPSGGECHSELLTIGLQSGFPPHTP